MSQGFEEQNIIGVLNEDATKAGIQQAFEELNLNVGKGDIVFLYSYCFLYPQNPHLILPNSLTFAGF